MTFYPQLQYTDKIIDKVYGIQFGIMSPDEIRRRSVVEITETQTYQNNEPYPGGLFDPRLGVNDPDKICPTDGLDGRFCPGYFGHIELARPVFYVHYLEYVKKVFRCICFRCSKLLASKDNPDVANILRNYKLGYQRFQEIEKLMGKINKCGDKNHNGCNAKQPSTIKLDSINKIVAHWKLDTKDNKNTQMSFSADVVLKLFKRITDEDVEIMGFSKIWCRPDWMICSVLAVPPPSVRPSAKQENNQRMEDDLTCKLIDILKINNILKQRIDNLGVNNNLIESNNTIVQYTALLQYHIGTFIDNEIPGINPAQQRSGRPLKSIKQRLKSKEGRIRGNLMGKRVDFSARSVITPDPSIKVDQLGVPLKIAKNLTYPEIVNQFNIDKLQKLVNNGHLKYPGAKSIKFKSKNFRAFSLEYMKDEIILEYGDIVNRHLMDDDIVLFNRQPSLHKMSMMAHRIKIMSYNTFRLNVSVTSPYNADFDGDEMNMHVPQSIQAQNELRNLVMVPLQIISPKENKPVISIVQDTLLGIYRMTKKKVSFNLKEYMNIMSKNSHFNGFIDFSKQEYSGQDLITSILPSINLNMGNTKYDEEEGKKSNNWVEVNNGVVNKGIFDKDIFSKMSRGLVHIIFNDFGHNSAKNFLDNTQSIVREYLLHNGFSVGISDIVASDEIKNKIKLSIKDKKKEVEKLIQQLHLNIFDNKTGKPNSDIFEFKVMQLLQKAIDDVYKISSQELDSENNRMLNMADAGSKGKKLNISQMVACLGQQIVDGKRVSLGFTDRTLPHFNKYDDSPESRGFVNSSFMGGLNPQEFFFHAMGGREGLIDTAVKTSDTGYIQRKLMKAMEDLKVAYDFSVRNASNSIIQFIYGEDKMDATKVESQVLSFVKYSYQEMNQHFNFRLDEDWSHFLQDDIVNKIKSNQDFYQKYQLYFDNINSLKQLYIAKIKNYNSNQLNMIYFPIDIIRKINNYMVKFEDNRVEKSDIYPLNIINDINDILKQCNNKSIFFEILIKVNLNPVNLIKRLKMSSKTFNLLKLDIISSYKNSIIEPGEMVGAIAAQSVGEPATQMTLNTFHQAGAGSGITAGVPRLKELLGISRNPRSPSMTIFLDSSINNDLEKSKAIMQELEITTLKEITISSSIYYDPYDCQSTVDEDDEFLKIYQVFNELDEKCKNIDSKKSDWILRLEFDKSTLLNKNITIEEIYNIINYNKNFKNFNCLYSDFNSAKLISRIRLNNSDNDDIKNLKLIEKDLLEGTIIRGIKKLNKIIIKNINDYGFINGEEKFENRKEWILETSGVNLMDVLSHPLVDKTKIICNDIWEVYNTLGIEAARETIYQQIKNCINDSSGGYINYRHLYLLVDIMTHRGTLMSIDRHGINKGNIGPLAKCSFEETTDQLLKASVFGKTDNINGVSSNIMLGQVAPCGTGIPQILVDEVKLMDIYKNYDFSKYSNKSSKSKGKQDIDNSQLSDDLPSDVDSEQEDPDNDYDSDHDDDDLKDMLNFDFNPELNKDMNIDFIKIS